MGGDKEFNVYFQAGLKQFQSGKFAESLSEFFNAAQIDPTSSELHYYIGEALEKHRKQFGIENNAAVKDPGATTPLPSEEYKVSDADIEAPASEPIEGKRRLVPRYESRIPIIVVAYDAAGKFFAELAMTQITSVKGASIEMRRTLKMGAQLMIFTVDSKNAVPALVRNIRIEEANRQVIGVEFLKGPIDWLLPLNIIEES